MKGGIYMKIIKVEFLKENRIIDTIYIEQEAKALIQELKNANGAFKKMTSSNTADLVEFEKVHVSIININVRFYEVQKSQKHFKTVEKNKFGEWVAF